MFITKYKRFTTWATHQHQGKKAICRKDKLPRYHSATGLHYGENHARAPIEKKLRQKTNEAQVPHTRTHSFQKTTPQYRAVKKQRLRIIHCGQQPLILCQETECPFQDYFRMLLNMFKVIFISSIP